MTLYLLGILTGIGVSLLGRTVDEIRIVNRENRERREAAKRDE